MSLIGLRGKAHQAFADMHHAHRHGLGNGRRRQFAIGHGLQ
ncbi:hypothetical protein [Iodobacter sp. BJB302]|nr:hypothetical protein [Iodobacter sp. BJB302]